jgi:hypothetical protein
MKKKILNDIKIIILILIGVTILFAILGTFKGLKENMEDPPQCYSDYHSDVKCYSDVLASNEDESSSTHASYTETSDDKYILKTKIIPPKGTSCPIEISPPASKYLNGVATSSTSETTAPTTGTSTTQIQNSSNLNSSNTSTSSTNITNVGIPGTSGSNSSNTPVAADSASSSPSSVPGAENEAIVKNTATLNEIKGSLTQINQQKPKPETCPPCPACERCPEPAFDCKKVPNYRSPSIGQYLPMPILNDFSTF